MNALELIRYLMAHKEYVKIRIHGILFNRTVAVDYIVSYFEPGTVALWNINESKRNEGILIVNSTTK